MKFFTRETAARFCTEKLGVSITEDKLTSEPRRLLDELVTSLQTRLLFQNVRLLSLPPAVRHRPDCEEMKSDLVNGVGGLCYNLNVSAYFLLQGLGYEVSLAHSTCTTSVMFPNNHVIVYVHNVVSPGDKYLVDVGCGFPTFRAIDLSFETESPIYTDSFIEYKYVKHDGQILRFHRNGCSIIKSGIPNPETDFYIGEWRRFYKADVRSSTDLSQFDSCFDSVWSNASASPFHSSLRVIGFPNKRAVMIVNNTKIVEHEDGCLVSSEIGEEDLERAVSELFTVFPRSMVKQALINYRAAQ